MRKTTAITVALAAALGLLSTTSASPAATLAFDTARPHGYLRSSSSSFLRGMMFDQGEPMAPPPEQEGGQKDAEAVPGLPPPLPPMAVDVKEEVEKAGQEEVQVPLKMYDGGEPVAPQPQPISDPVAHRHPSNKMLDQGEPMAPPPVQPVENPPTHKTYAHGQARAADSEPLYDGGAPAAPQPSRSQARAADSEPLHDPGKPAAPQPSWARHNSSPSETFEYRVGKDATTTASPYPAPVDQEEGDTPFEGRDRVLEGGVPVCAPAFAWTSEKGELRVNGMPFHLKGLNWFGFETERTMLDGLDVNSMDFYFQFMKDQQFNAIRIPISVDMALDPNGTPKADVVDAVRCSFIHLSTFIRLTHSMTHLHVLILSFPPSTTLQPLIAQNNFQRLSTLVDRAGDFGLLVMLDMHRLSPDEDITPLWYDDRHTFDTYLEAWDNVLSVFGAKWNVFAIGTLNESGISSFLSS